MMKGKTLYVRRKNHHVTKHNENKYRQLPQSGAQKEKLEEYSWSRVYDFGIASTTEMAGFEIQKHFEIHSFGLHHRPNRFAHDNIISRYCKQESISTITDQHNICLVLYKEEANSGLGLFEIILQQLEFQEFLIMKL